MANAQTQLCLAEALVIQSLLGCDSDSESSGDILRGTATSTSLTCKLQASIKQKYNTRFDS